LHLAGISSLLGAMNSNLNKKCTIFILSSKKFKNYVRNYNNINKNNVNINPEFNPNNKKK